MKKTYSIDPAVLYWSPTTTTAVGTGGYELYPASTTSTTSTLKLKAYPTSNKLTGHALKAWVDRFLREEGYVPR